MIRLRDPSGLLAKGQEVRLGQYDSQRNQMMWSWQRCERPSLGNYGSGENGPSALHWIAQEDPHFTFVPAGSNEEIKIALVPKFPRTVSEESESEQRIPQGPLLDGHPVVHESGVLCALETFQAEMVKKMHEVISEITGQTVEFGVWTR